MAEPNEVLSQCHPFPQPRSTPSSLAGHRGGNGDILRGTSSSAVLVAAALVINRSSRGWAYWVPHPNPDGELDGRVWADWKVGPRQAQLVQTMLASAVMKKANFQKPHVKLSKHFQNFCRTFCSM